MERIAIYCRLSDEDRNKKNKCDESESIQNQKNMLTNYCAEKGWEHYKIYCDEDYSGADKKRPGFNSMINDCKNGLISVVLCKSQSRFSRDIETIEYYIHNKFLEWNVRFISIIDNADTKVKGNKKSRQINGLINEWYLEELSENIRKTLKNKNKQGKYTGSFAPYGYLIDPNNKNRLIIDPIASQTVKDIFNMYIKGMGYIKIAKELNRRHIPSPTAYKIQQGSKYYNACFNSSVRGSLWSESTIYRILRREVYTGVLVQGKSENLSYKNKKRRYLPEDKWIKFPNAHEPIISDETWKKTLDIRSEKGKCDKFSGETHPLSGKVFCAECGDKMWKMSYQSTHGRYKYLKCKTSKISESQCPNKSSVRLDYIESIILSQINALIDKLYDNELIKSKILTGGVNNAKPLLDEKNMLSQLKNRKEFHMLRAYEDKLENVITERQFKSVNEKLSAEIKDLSERLDIIEKNLSSISDNENREVIIDRILKKYRRIDKLNKALADEFIESIFIGKANQLGKRDIKINWKI